jgi:hypothetical protein
MLLSAGADRQIAVSERFNAKAQRSYQLSVISYQLNTKELTRRNGGTEERRNGGTEHLLLLLLRLLLPNGFVVVVVVERKRTEGRGLRTEAKTKIQDLPQSNRGSGARRHSPPQQRVCSSGSGTGSCSGGGGGGGATFCGGAGGFEPPYKNR